MICLVLTSGVSFQSTLFFFVWEAGRGGGGGGGLVLEIRSDKGLAVVVVTGTVFALQ